MKKLVICSGGLDSVGMAVIESREHDVTLVNFNYGQKGSSELAVCRAVAGRLGLPLVRLDVSGLLDIFGNNQLTNSNFMVEGQYQQSVVVPLRNALFCQVAMIYATSHGFDEIVLGSHTDDIVEVDGERLYPDCSIEFFKTFELAMQFGKFRKDRVVKINSASIQGMSKADIIRKTYSIDKDILFMTWSCYLSGDKQCGVCESCLNRKKAFALAGIKDLTEYER